MGPTQEAKPKLFHYGFNLEKRIRANNPLRRIQQVMDFSFVRDAVKDHYGKKGHKSEDPIVVMKLMFLLFLDDVPSERELMRLVGERLDYMWFLGFDLDDDIPNHSILSKARRLWSQPVFEEVFVTAVQRCIENGLIDGKKIHMDGTLINGNASKDSVKRGPAVLIEQLRQVYRAQEKKLDESPCNDARTKPDKAQSEPTSDNGNYRVAPVGAEKVESLGLFEKPKPDVETPDASELRHARATVPAEEMARPSEAEFRTTSLSICSRNNHIVVRRPAAGPEATLSTTDMDTAVVRKGSGDGARPRYKNHRVVDNQCGVITATQTTAGDVSENTMLMQLVDQHERNTGRRVDTTVGDAQYGTNDNFADCEGRGIRSHMADLRSTFKNAQSAAVFGEDQFQYDEEKDCYQCPAGESLIRKQDDRNYQVYVISGKICNACALREQCTRSRNGRKLKRHRRHELVERARLRSHSAGARQDRKRRRYLMEGSFADGANNHGLKRARWRGLDKQQIQDYLIAACQNIRILIRFGIRPAPAVSMAATLPPATEVMIVSGGKPLSLPFKVSKRPASFPRFHRKHRMFHAKLTEDRFGQHALTPWAML